MRSGWPPLPARCARLSGPPDPSGTRSPAWPPRPPAPTASRTCWSSWPRRPGGATGAASLSVSRWDREREVLHTLINVGDLGPGEERYPENERYPISEHPLLARMLKLGQPYFNAIDDPAADLAATALLRSLGKESDVGVPILVDGRDLGRGVGHHGAGPAALPGHGRPLPGRDRHPAEPGARARGAVLARLPAGLRGLAHRPGKPPRRCWRSWSGPPRGLPRERAS